MALAQPLHDAGLVVGMLAGQCHAVAAAGASWLLSLSGLPADDHAAPANRAVAIHSLNVLLQHLHNISVAELVNVLIHKGARWAHFVRLEECC